MKAVFTRSSLIGFVAMIIVAMTIMAVGVFYATVEPGEKDILGLVYLAWFPISMVSPVALPVLILIVSLITWQLTKNLTTTVNIKDGKKQLMTSVWVSTSLATAPYFLLTLVLLAGSITATPKNGGDASGYGMAMFFSMLCLFWNMFLILLTGFLARFMVREPSDEKAIPILR